MVVLGSRDTDYQALLDRARIYVRRIVRAPSAGRVSGDMLTTARLFPRGGGAGHRS